jgi:hypothetical protein
VGRRGSEGCTGLKYTGFVGLVECDMLSEFAEVGLHAEGKAEGKADMFGSMALVGAS